jgi:hypothetical protein
MKSRLILAAVVVAAIAAFYWVTIRPAMQGTPPKVDRKQVDQAFKDFKPPEIPPPPLPQVVIATPVLPPPSRPVPIVAPRNDPVPGPLQVPIQDGATIDFSTGHPQVRMQGKDQEALDRALKEMAEATKNVTFPPPKK